MTIRDVTFVSRQYAESQVADPHTAVISITDPGKPEAQLDPEIPALLRLSFFDSLPGDEYLPTPVPGLFDQGMARTVADFVQQIHSAPEDMAILVHCEYGISRSAAVALFVEAYAGASLKGRAYARRANRWVLERLLRLCPEVDVSIPA